MISCNFHQNVTQSQTLGHCVQNWGSSVSISSPGGSPGRAIVLPSALASVAVVVSNKFNVKVFYVMGKALSGELSCPCDRSCLEQNQGLITGPKFALGKSLN